MSNPEDKTVGEAIDDIIAKVDDNLGIKIDSVIDILRSGVETASESMAAMCEEADHWVDTIHKSTMNTDKSLDHLILLHDTFKLRATDQNEQDIITAITLYLENIIDE